MEVPRRPSGFEQIYPNIACWVTSSGWIEIGADDYSQSLVRALDEGGMVWESSEDDASVNEALRTLDLILAQRMQGYYA
jgi:hypothetical protein